MGADAGLLPISYFYDTQKTEEVFTYYTITKNNNIRVTNTPVQITVPSSISIPIGGCSQPVVVDILHPPVDDFGISFNYDNSIYTEVLFWPNSHTTKSEMRFTTSDTTNLLSFCIDSNYVVGGLQASSFELELINIGTNYASYSFSPSSTITVNIVAPAASPPTPTIAIEAVNVQKSFLGFNLTTNTEGAIYYYLQLGQDQPPLDIVQLHVNLKNHVETLQSMQDFLDHRVYTEERDQRIGVRIEAAGEYTLRLEDLLPERYYTLCGYL